jgi:asparaginyl-tRNA synthetase
MEKIYIKDFPNHVDQTVRLEGWLYNLRGSGKVAFMQLRDGTGYVQCVMGKSDVPEEVFEKRKQLTQESSIWIEGKVVKDDRAPSGYEVQVSNLGIFHVAEPYPITKLKEGEHHGIDFLLSHRHLWLRSTRQIATMRIRNEVIKSIRDYFYDNDFVLIDSPILTSSVGESSSTLFETEYFDLGKASLAQTGQLYLEAAIFGLNKVYCFGPTFRAEKSKTRRHLTEFWMVEGEYAFYDNDDNMDFQEGFVRYIVTRVMERCAQELKTLERDVSKLEAVQSAFVRISYDDAVAFLQSKGHKITWGDDLGAPDEVVIGEKYEAPVFVYNYPKKCKAFYMKENPVNPDTVLCSDLLAPEGFGEIIGASQREDDYDKLHSRILEEKLPLESYEWYLDLRRYGSVIHSGFGLGVERTVAWICGTEHIRECIPFPRMLYRIYP